MSDLVNPSTTEPLRDAMSHSKVSPPEMTELEQQLFEVRKQLDEIRSLPTGDETAAILLDLQNAEEMLVNVLHMSSEIETTLEVGAYPEPLVRQEEPVDSQEEVESKKSCKLPQDQFICPKYDALSRYKRDYGLHVGSLCCFEARSYSGQATRNLGWVLQLSDGDDELDNGITDISKEDVELFEERCRVLVCYAAPISQQQIPCKNFFEQATCSFGYRCRFSHGRYVPLRNVTPFTWNSETDIYINQHVLAKYKDGLWYPGKVRNIFKESSNATSSEARDSSYLNSSSQIPEFQAEVMFDAPYLHEYILSASSILPNVFSMLEVAGNSTKEVEASSNVSSGIDVAPNDMTALDSDSLDTDASTGTEEGVDPHESTKESLVHPDGDEFGKWMKYTSGFGLKMLQKMGYEIGQPLGAKTRAESLGRGLVNPIPIRVLKPGLALDFISKDIGRKRRARRGSGKNRLALKFGYDYVKSMEKNSRSKGMFSLMNSGLLTGMGNLHDQQEAQRKKGEGIHFNRMSALRRSAESETELRKRLLSCTEDIRALQRDMSGHENNLKRHMDSNLQSLLSTYSNIYTERLTRLKRLEDEQKVIQGKLDEFSKKKKLKFF